MKILKSFKSVVSVYNSSVQVIQIRCGKSATVQLNHRTQIGWNDWNHRKDHPFRLVVGLSESLNNLKTLNKSHLLLTNGLTAFFLLLNGKSLYSIIKLFCKLIQIYLLKQFLNGFCAHARSEGILSKAFNSFLVVLVGKNLFSFKGSITLIKNNVRCKI